MLVYFTGNRNSEMIKLSRIYERRWKTLLRNCAEYH